MDFEGPDVADLAQVHALNQAFLDFLAVQRSLQERLSPEVMALLCRAGPLQRQRIARSPFLIFSLREADETCWTRFFQTPGEGDLVDALCRPSTDEAQLVSATLGFLWQFAKRNPYSARVVSGAPPDWCERIAASNLVDLFRFAASTRDLLTLRCEDNLGLWRKLCQAGTSGEPAVRASARITALQTVLTGVRAARYRPLKTAACRMPVSGRKVAEHPAVSNKDQRGYNTRLNESTAPTESTKDIRER